MENLSGKKFGRLQVVRNSGQKKSGRVLWECRCDCGNTCLANTTALKSGTKTSCGCARKGIHTKDLTGQRFGKLTTIRQTEQRSKQNKIMWECRCDCGTTCYVSTGNLAGGRIKSCGCETRRAALENLKKAREEKKKGEIDGTDVWTLTQEKRADNTSGHTGVNRTVTGRYYATIIFKGKLYYLGIYDLYADAVAAREDAEEKLHGNFLRWYERTYPEQWEKIQRRKAGGEMDEQEQKPTYPGVNYDKRGNSWVAHICYKSRMYQIGTYPTEAEAVAARERMEALKQASEKWHQWIEEKEGARSRRSEHPGVSYSKPNKGWTAYIHAEGKRYHIGTYQTEGEAIAARQRIEALKEQDSAEWHQWLESTQKKRRKSGDGSGVYYNKQNKGWMAYINAEGKRYYIGIYKTEEEAIEARQRMEALKEQDSAEWHQWLASPKKRGRKSGNGSGVSYNKQNKGWKAYIYNAHKRYHIGTYQTEGEAIAARQRIEALKEQDSAEWHQWIKEKERARDRVGVSYNKRNKTWKADIYAEGKRYYIGTYKTEEEAIEERQRMEALREQDSEKWHQWLASPKKRGRKSGNGSGVSYSKKNKNWVAYIYNDKKVYYIGAYQTQEEAIEARQRMEALKEQDSVEWHQWLAAPKKRGRKSGNGSGVYYDKQRKGWRAYIYADGKQYYIGTYPTEAGAIEERERMEALKEQDSAEWHQWLESTQKRRRKSGNGSGVSYNKQNKGWMAYINAEGKRYYIGTYQTEAEAIEARQRIEALKEQDSAEWHQWVESKKTDGRRKSEKGYPGVYYNNPRDLWVALITYQSEGYYIGAYQTEEEAIEQRRRMEELKEQDSPEWHQWLEEKKKKIYAKCPGVSYNKRQNTWIAYISVQGKSSYIGTYATKEEAIEARKRMETLKEQDSPEWHQWLEEKGNGGRKK